MSTITIGGFMATGKSSVGKELAEQLARPFVDLDVLIEQRIWTELSVSIEELFSEFGEAVFRKIEQETLVDFLENHNTDSVLALGGGTLHNGSLSDAVTEQTKLFVLRANWETVSDRINQSSRPLRMSAKKLYLERNSGFNVGIQIQVDNKSIDEIVFELVNQVTLC